MRVVLESRYSPVCGGHPTVVDMYTECHEGGPRISILPRVWWSSYGGKQVDRVS